MATRATFTPVVTLTEQPDGSYVADVDWLSSLIHAEVDEVQVDFDTHPAALRASEALDAYIKTVPAMRGFVVPGCDA